MDTALTEEQRLFQRSLRDLLAKIAPSSVIQELDEKEQFPREILDVLAEFGLFGVGVAEEYGGSGGGLVELAIVLEELAFSGASLALAYGPTAGFSRQAIQSFGSEEHKREFLPPIAAGKLRMAMGLTEPDHGSDLITLETTADLESDEYVVRGNKIFILAADNSQYIFLAARTDRNAPQRRSISILLTPTNLPGITIRPMKTLGGQAAHTCEVTFDEVRLPKANLLYEPNQGWRVITEYLDEERIMMGAEILGTARGAFECALRYAKERVQFGQPIGKFQAIAHMLADMATDVEITRLLLYTNIARKLNGLPCSKEASMARVFSSEAAMRTAHKSVQILGGYGYMMEYDAQRYFREAKLWEIAGGTNQIQRDVIAHELGL